MVKISVDWKGATELHRYFNRLGSWLQLELPMLTQQQAVEGKEFAAGIAPNQTGALISAIGIRKGSDKEYNIVSRVPKGASNPRNVPYQVYLHAGARGNYRGGKKSGDHQYMETTYNHIKNRYPQRVERALDKQLKQ